MKIPFSPPRIDSKIVDAVTEALYSGWITTGPRTKLFERRISQYCETESAVCLNSATAGLEFVLRWFGVGPGDEVIVPAYTYCASSNIIFHCGAKPVIVDILPSNFLISVNAIRDAVTSKTKVIIPVDFAGMPCDYDEIMSLVKSQEVISLFSPSTDAQKALGRILVLSDSAHSFGAYYKGKKTGSLADFSVFSFHAVKNLTTAEGGAITFNNLPDYTSEDLYNYFNLLALHGQSKDALSKMQLGGWKYDVVMPGYKANMTDILASIGLVELERYDTEMLPKLRSIFLIYESVLKDHSWAILPIHSDAHRKSSFHIFALRIKNFSEAMRDRLIDILAEKGIATNVHFQPLPMFSFYKQEGYRIEDCPLAYLEYSHEISLPVYYDLTEKQAKYVAREVVSAVELIFGK